MKIYNTTVEIDDIKGFLWYHENGGNNYFFSKLKGINFYEDAKGEIKVTPMYTPFVNIMTYHNGILGLEFIGKHLLVFGRRKPWVVYQKASDEPQWREA